MNTKMQSLIVRTADYNDLAHLKPLLMQLVENAHPNIEDMDDMLYEIYDNPFNRVFVVEYNQKIVGTAQVIIYDNLIRTPNRKAIIDSVVVDNELRGKYIGKELISYILTYCKSMEVSKINLVSSYRRFQAYDFYRAMGFKDVGLGFELVM